MQKNIKALQEAKVQLIAVSYDKVEVLQEFAKGAKIAFPLLSDPESKVIDEYGIRNTEAKGSRIDGVPYPGTILVDRNGKIAAKLFYEGYKKRHLADDIIAAAKPLMDKPKRAAE